MSEQELGEALKSLLDWSQRSSELKAATMWLMQNAMTNPNNAGAGAHHYMHIMGIVSLGLMWLRASASRPMLVRCGARSKWALAA